MEAQSYFKIVRNEAKQWFYLYFMAKQWFYLPVGER